MRWSFERVFYGRRDGLNLESIRDFLARGYYPIPRTFFNGYYRAVHRVGDHDRIYDRIEKVFPDVLLAQKPEHKFALHFSGGFDSSIVARLYDREDADYIHFTGPESGKARALAAMLKGRLVEIQVTPEMFIREADELIPRMAEPYTFEDVVFAYIAGKKARELGHTLIVTGDGGDWVFGGYNVGPDSKEAADIWKTIEPNRLLGLETLQPLGHLALELWSLTTLAEAERRPDKLFARQYCRDLGMPEEIVTQKKVPWAGSMGTRGNELVVRHMQGVVENSDYRWITGFEFVTPPIVDLLFRQYSLVKWLQANYKESLDQQEIRDLSRQLREFNDVERKTAMVRHRKERIKRLLPPATIAAARSLLRSWRKLKKGTGRPGAGGSAPARGFDGSRLGHA